MSSLEDGRRDWFVDEAVIAAAEEGLKKGRYEGVGEIHFMSGFRPKPNNRVFERLMGLAAEYEVPALVHVDAGSKRAIVNICSRHPAVNILFAHAGGNLRPKHVEAVIEKCPRILIELSARDPWRYGRLTDDNGKLLPKWRDVIVRYPQRFVVGTDPVWRVTEHSPGMKLMKVGTISANSFSTTGGGWPRYPRTSDEPSLVITRPGCSVDCDVLPVIGA